MKKGLLLLEGGAYRGIFTSGVLDAFLENDIYFDTVVGISAGALCGYNYVSKDIGRSKKIIIEHGQDKRYFGISNLIKTGSAFGSDYVFNDLPKEIPFNTEQFINGAEFYVGATNCETGVCEYFSKSKENDFVSCVVASASMPLVSKMVNINDNYYLDGGISEHLPLGFIDSEKFDYVVSVLTRPINSTKKDIPRTQKRLYKIKYKNYPILLDKLISEAEVFNEQREKIKKVYDEGKMLVVEPDERFLVKRLERNVGKLEAGYKLGYEAGLDAVRKIKVMLS